MKKAVLAAALMLAGCQDGDSTMPLPRLTCTQVTALYSCGRGGTCEQCGNWAIGCPKPLSLRQIPTGSYDKGEPRLACRLKEDDDGFNDGMASPHEASPPLR